MVGGELGGAGYGWRWEGLQGMVGGGGGGTGYIPMSGEEG